MLQVSYCNLMKETIHDAKQSINHETENIKQIDSKAEIIPKKNQKKLN